MVRTALSVLLLATLAVPRAAAAAAGEPMMVGGLIAAGAGIGMLVAGLATKTPELTAAGAVTWPVGATVHFAGLGLFVSETRPYFRDLQESSSPGLAPTTPLAP